MGAHHFGGHHDEGLDLEGELADDEVLTYLQMLSPDDLCPASDRWPSSRFRSSTNGHLWSVARPSASAVPTAGPVNGGMTSNGGPT